MMPAVYNKHKPHPKDAVYIGRGSKWGNPFVIGKDGSREEVIEKYQSWILNQDVLLDSLDELRNKDLLCFCSPHLCHGDILLKMAEIPDGLYCYHIESVDKNTGKIKTRMCPFWYNARCSLIDNDDNWQEDSLLWDQVKECQIRTAEDIT